jgi:hypothetical protein
MMGSCEAVQDTTMSKLASCSGRSARRMARPLKRWASVSPRSMVRLATVRVLGFWAAKWVAHSSIISPAPMKSTFWPEIESKMRCDSRTAAAAIETLWAPISVVLRTSLATAKVRWNSWCR